jgi:hypothetical protein
LARRSLARRRPDPAKENERGGVSDPALQAQAPAAPRPTRSRCRSSTTTYAAVSRKWRRTSRIPPHRPDSLPCTVGRSATGDRPGLVAVPWGPCLGASLLLLMAARRGRSRPPFKVANRDLEARIQHQIPALRPDGERRHHGGQCSEPSARHAASPRYQYPRLDSIGLLLPGNINIRSPIHFLDAPSTWSLHI